MWVREDALARRVSLVWENKGSEGCGTGWSPMREHDRFNQVKRSWRVSGHLGQSEGDSHLL